MIIALSGYARSGKDSIANVLVEGYGFRRTAFADTLRSCVEALNPIIDADPDGNLIRYNDIVRDRGYDRGKEDFEEFRGILQRMGTEVGRNILGSNIWVDLTLNKMRSSENNWVITDCRFPNEALGVKEISAAQVWRVERKGVRAANDHISEHSLDGFEFDQIIYNDGTLEDLAVAVHDAVVGNLW